MIYDLFEMVLTDVEQLREPENTSIFTDPKGHAGDLEGYGGLIWLGSIWVVLSSTPSSAITTDLAEWRKMS